MPRRALLVTVLTLLLAPAPAAHAAPDCVTPLPAPRPLLTGQGVLESVIVDDRGRLLYTDTTREALMRLDAPGAAPVVHAGGIDKPGGLALDADGSILVGQGNGFADGALGNAAPAARILRVDPDTGAATEYARGLQMANGLARAGDGTVYASTDVGLGIDRVAPGGAAVENRWAPVVSSNGLAIDGAGRWLYAAQTFVPAAIARVDLASSPPRVERYVAAGPLDAAAGLDGMTTDPLDRLVAAANGAGQVWRVGADRRICVLARGVLFPSAVAYGRGDGPFPAGRLYVVTFSGVVAEVPAG